MVSLNADQITTEIIRLFDPDKPTMPRAFNVLEGLNRGQILADDPVHPTWAVVRDVIYGTLYFGGQVNDSLVAVLVERFRHVGEVGIGCWLNDPLIEMIPPDHEYDGRTLYFTERSPSTGLQVPELPPGYRLVSRDRDLFARSFDYEATLNAFGNVESVLQHTLGYVVLHNDHLVCEAATGAPTQSRIEVGVTTAEPYRGQGFATITCAKLIETCEARGYSTWWDCAKQNIPSTKLARKLGYRNEREYRYVWWSKKDQ